MLKINNKKSLAQFDLVHIFRLTILLFLNRLLATHFPHLCLIEDWLDEDLVQSPDASDVLCVSELPCNKNNLKKGSYGRSI
jgi:hypothetical protein